MPARLLDSLRERARFGRTRPDRLSPTEAHQLKTGYLHKMDIFRDLSHDEVEAIGRATTMITCRRGKVFYEPHDPGEVLFLIKAGRVQLSRLSPDGRKLVVATLGPGTFFGEMALIAQAMHNTSAEAVEDSLICVMSRRDVESLLLSRPQVALRLVAALSERLQQLEAQSEALAFRSVPARLAAALLAAAGGTDQVQGLTHRDLAERIGAYRETVTFTLNEFQREGLVALGRQAIQILDRPRLVARAEG